MPASFADAVDMNGQVTQRRSPAKRRAAVGALLLSGVGVAIVVMALLVNQIPAAWFVYVMAAVIVGSMVVSVPHPRRLVLGLTILSLQVNANVYVIQQEGDSRVGVSGPGGIRYPLFALFALVLLVMEAAGFDTDARRVEVPPMFRRPLLYYLGAIILSGLATPELHLWAFYVHQQVLTGIILVAVANAIRDERDVDLVIRALLIAAAMQAVVFFLESATGMSFNPEGHAYHVNDPKEHGGTFYSHSNGLAGFLAPLVVLGFSEVLRRGGRLNASVILLGLGAAGLLGTMARAAWIGCALGGTFVLWVGTRRKLIDVTRVALVGMGALLLVGFFASSLAERVSANHARDYEERKALMGMAWNVYVAHPLIGCGAGAYAQVFKSYLTNEQLGKWLFVVHNRYLLTAAEMGTIGLLAFLSILRAWFRTAYGLLESQHQCTRMLGLGLGGALVAVGWHMYWEPLTGLPIDGLLYAMMGLAAAVARLDDSSARRGRLRSGRDQGATVGQGVA